VSRTHTAVSLAVCALSLVSEGCGGQPTQNAFAESVNGRSLDECLNTHRFSALARPARHRHLAEALQCRTAPRLELQHGLLLGIRSHVKCIPDLLGLERCR